MTRALYTFSMKTRLIGLVVLFSSSLALALLPSGAVLEKLDDAYRDRRDFGRFQVAMEGYRKNHAQFPSDPQLGWRVAMASSYLGLRVETDDLAITKAFNDGCLAAASALEADPQCVPCHFWRAVNQVLYAERVGVLKMLFSVKEVREHFRFVADHDPSFMWGASLRFLGIIDWKLPGLLGGDNDRARDYFVKALEYGPNEAMNYQVYHQFLEAEGPKNEFALVVLQKGANLSEPIAERVESYDAWQDLKIILEKRREALRPSLKTASTSDLKRQQTL